MEFDELPENWSVWCFEKALQIRKGSVDPATVPDESFHLFSIPAFDETGQPEAKFGREIGSSKTLVHPGDCLFSKLNPRIPRTWVVPSANGRRQIASTEFWPLRSRFNPDEDGYLAPEFLKWLFRCEDFLDAFRGEVSGGVQSRQRLQQDNLLGVDIPVPPLAEQRRVVARVEALIRHLDQARQARQAALAEAETVFTAELNRQFNDEFMSRHNSFSLEEVAEIRSGVTLGRKLEGQTVSLPYLRVANVQDGHLDLREIKTLSILEREREKWQLRFGDLLLTEGGDWDKLGRGTIWRSEIPDCIHQNHIFRVRVNAPDLEPTFVAALVWSPCGKAYFQVASKQTTNLASINQTQLRAFRVCKPPLAEQRAIVARLDALRVKLDELQRLQREVEALLSSFTPALLAKAFRGEL